MRPHVVAPHHMVHACSHMRISHFSQPFHWLTLVDFDRTKVHLVATTRSSPLSLFAILQSPKSSENFNKIELVKKIPVKSPRSRKVEPVQMDQLAICAVPNLFIFQKKINYSKNVDF